MRRWTFGAFAALAVAAAVLAWVLLREPTAYCGTRRYNPERQHCVVD